MVNIFKMKLSIFILGLYLPVGLFLLINPDYYGDIIYVLTKNDYASALTDELTYTLCGTIFHIVRIINLILIISIISIIAYLKGRINEKKD